MSIYSHTGSCFECNKENTSQRLMEDKWLCVDCQKKKCCEWQLLNTSYEEISGMPHYGTTKRLYTPGGYIYLIKTSKGEYCHFVPGVF